MSLPIPSADLPPFERLCAIMTALRGPGGCSWDAEQTHESLKKHLIEEAYEVAEAIEEGGEADLIDELGDLLLQPVFHAEIARSDGRWSIDDVCQGLCEKLIRRHPHVFGETHADDPDAVVAQWDAIKDQEKQARGEEVVPDWLGATGKGLPALMAAQKIQKRAAKVGFDWPEAVQVLDKVKEEVSEVEEALADQDAAAIEEELGDLLFCVVNLVRKTGSDAETTLMKANAKFRRRFQSVEQGLREQGSSVQEASLDEMEEQWIQAKKSG